MTSESGCIEPKLIWFLNPLRRDPKVFSAIELFGETWLKKHLLPKNCELFHYTTLTGIRGILDTRSIWHGHVSTFNDPNELQYGRRIIVDLLTEKMQDEDSEAIRRFLKSVLVYVEAFGRYMYHIFVASFCESDNLLSQWRAYADHGGGYCLGLRFSTVTRLGSDPANLEPGDSVFLRKVIYDPAQQHDLVRHYVCHVLDAIRKQIGDAREDQIDLEMSAIAAANVLFDFLISFKHPAFEQEAEWRIIRGTREDAKPENVEFRITNSSLIPYRPTFIFNKSEKDGLQFPLTSIRFGPSLDALSTAASLELYLQKIATREHPIGIQPTVPIAGAGFSLR